MIIQEICAYLEIPTQILISSEEDFNYEGVQDAGDWALRISEQMKAHEYINPIGGVNIFDPSKFRASSIKLSFLKSDDITYKQGDAFEPWLSIIDILMFNGRVSTENLLNFYSIMPTQ